MSSLLTSFAVGSGRVVSHSENGWDGGWTALSSFLATNGSVAIAAGGFGRVNP